MTEPRTITTASAFLDSIGSNTKGSMYVDGYRNSSLILESLRYIGVDKVRETFAEYGEGRPVLDAMANAGIEFDFRVSYTLPAKDGPGLSGYLDALKSFTAEHPGSILAIEGVNEANRNSVAHEGSVGLNAAIDFQRDLFRAVKADPILSKVPVLNLSIADDDAAAYARIGDLGRYSDAANAHSYTHTGKTADVQIQDTLDLARAASKGDPAVITELGHTTLRSEPGIGVSELAQAKLLLSNLLLSFENGARTTYIYDLIDTGSSAVRDPKEAQFGIFEDDGTPKLAATALHNLNAILTHGDTGTATTANISYDLSGAPTNTHSMLMAKSGGVYDIVVWTDAIVFDDVTNRDVANAAKSVRIDLAQVEDVVRVYDPLVGLAPVAIYRDTKSFTVPVSDHPLVIEVGAATAVREPTTTVPSTLSLSADSFVAQMATLSDAAGLKTIRLTDSHVLDVSSFETMTYAIKNYASLLAKVEGGVSFEVAHGEATWRKVQAFDAQGRLTERTDYGLDGNEVTSKIAYHANGTRDIYTYGVEGQDWTTVHQHLDAQNQLTLIERLRDDGSAVYRERWAADDTKRYSYYDDDGKLETEVKVAASGDARTTLTYDPLTQKLASLVVREADGDVVATRYTNGVRTGYHIDSHRGWEQDVTYDSQTGKMLSNYTVRPDGTASNKTYVDGVLTKVNAKLADGSLDNWTYKIAGKSYVTEHQTNDASGQVTLVERLHADGSLDYREERNADGSREIATYDAAGVIITDTTIQTNGSKVFENHLRDGSGDVWVERSTAGGTLLTRNIEHADGEQDVLAFANAQKLVGGAGDDVFNFRSTTGGTIVYGGGDDTVINLNAGDRIAIGDEWALRFSDLHMTQRGADVLIRFDADDSILVTQARVADLHGDFFLLT